MTPESRAARRAHAETVLASTTDAWIATSAGSVPHLVPLSFLWDGGRLWFATGASNPTGRNVDSNHQVRAAVGTTRDLVILAGSVHAADADVIPLRAFVDKLGFEPADVGDGGQLYVLTPHMIQAWTSRAGADRWLMRDGHWLV